MNAHSKASRVARLLTSALLAGTMAATLMPSPSFSADDLSGTIRFTWWGATTRNQKTEQIVKLFEQANPGVKVLAEPGEWNSYWDKLTVQSASGNQPCSITMQSRWLNQYADPAILKPLDDMVKSGALDVSGVDKNVLDSGRGPDGNLYFIPHGVFYFVILMNKTEIEKAGLSLPSNDFTWDDYAKFARDLAAKLPDGTYATGNMGTNMDAFTNWVQGRGEVLFNPDGSVGVTPETIQAFFEYWDALRQDGITEPADKMAELPDNIIDQTLLANGKIMMDSRPANQLDGHQNVLNTAAPGEELVIHTYPVGPAGPGDDIGSNGFAIGANCDDNGTKIATAWMNFFLENPEAAQIYWSDNGVVSVDKFQKQQAEDPNASEGLRQFIKVFADVAPRAKSAYFPSGGYQAVSQALTNYYEAVAFGKQSPADAAKAMVAEVTRLTR